MIVQHTKTAIVDEIHAIIMEKGIEAYFTVSEIDRLSRPSGIRSLCVRYLAKSMLLEALGNDFSFTDISIGNSPEGAPIVEYGNNGIEVRLKELGIQKIFLSFTHTRKMVGVFMIFT